MPRRGPEKAGDRGTGMLMGAGPGRQDGSDCKQCSVPGGIRPDLSQRTLSGRLPLLTKRQKRLNIIHRQTMGAEVKVGSR